ncbi:MAG: hypothetical protein PHW46_00480 [Candidatus Omnitrophica bacterium]|nr:hypothetical protein [Candidatus Omnitrophota bacterium]
MGMSNQKIFFKISSSVVLLLFGSSVIFPAVHSQSQEALFYPQRGMCYVTWEKDRFSSQYSNESLQKLVSIGVDYISICVTYYQEKYNSTEIKATEQTPSDKSIQYVIKNAHKLGLKVMLKPHVDLIDRYDGTYWRADIGFVTEEDWEKWFKEYEKIILHYAQMCKEYEVELYCVGTELSFTAQKESRWRDLIAKVRAECSSQLVYAANWNDYKDVNFWDVLDYVGIDAYFPISTKSTPTLEDLISGWKKWECEIESWLETVNKKIVFTEIGYPSTSHAAITPWENPTGGNPDVDIQAICYKAFFETIWNEPWLAGVYWWKWDTNVNAGGKNNRQFTPQNKPAQEIVELNYKNVASRDTDAESA